MFLGRRGQGTPYSRYLKVSRRYIYLKVSSRYIWDHDHEENDAIMKNDGRNKFALDGLEDLFLACSLLFSI